MMRAAPRSSPSRTSWKARLLRDKLGFDVAFQYGEPTLLYRPLLGWGRCPPIAAAKAPRLPAAPSHFRR